MLLSDVFSEILKNMNNIKLEILEFKCIYILLLYLACTFEDREAQYIGNSFESSSLTSIRSLNLYGCHLSPNGSYRILKSFLSFHFNELKILNFSGNNIGAKGWTTFFYCLQNNRIPQLEELNIACCDLYENYFSSILSYDIKLQCNNLKAIVFMGNSLKSLGIQWLSAAIRSHSFPNLEIINLQDCSIATLEALILFNSLSTEYVSKLKFLNISSIMFY